MYTKKYTIYKTKNLETIEKTQCSIQVKHGRGCSIKDKYEDFGRLKTDIDCSIEAEKKNLKVKSIDNN